MALGCMQVGCGADELIDLLMRCVLDPGDTIVDCPPTFTMYAFDAAVNGADVITVPRLPGFRVDVPGELQLPGPPPLQHQRTRSVAWQVWLELGRGCGDVRSMVRALGRSQVCTMAWTPAPRGVHARCRAQALCGQWRSGRPRWCS